MQHPFRLPALRPTRWSLVYCVAVSGTAAVGFVGHWPWAIGVAALLALPASLVTVPAYYVVFGILALVPGANPSTSTGSGISTPGAGQLTASTGGAAAWFTTCTGIAGVLALVVAALLNVALVRAFASRRGQRGGLSRAGRSHPDRSG